MKRSALLVFSLLCCLTSTLARSAGKPSRPECGCTAENDPVCGNNGKQYSNACRAKCAKAKVACTGRCPCSNQPGPSEPTPVHPAACSCSSGGSPVCSTTGKTYGSSCLAACNNEKVACNHACPCDKACDAAFVRCARDPCTTAACPRYPLAECRTNNCRACTAEFYLYGKKIEDCNSRGCRCSKRYIPVCGSDKRTYGNDCLAKCEGVDTQCKGECPCPTTKPCACAKIYRPVCGANGETYANDCLATCAGIKTACQGKCPCNSNPKPCVCTREYKPVCGADGKTYGNSCEARCIQTEIKCDGRCPCDESTCHGLYHNCIVDPCLQATCSAYPGAQCKANYCHGCQAEFYVNGERVDCGANCKTEGEACTANYSYTSSVSSNSNCCSGLRCCAACNPLELGIYYSTGIHTHQAATCQRRCPMCKG